jgi:hypothetical protein
MAQTFLGFFEFAIADLGYFAVITGPFGLLSF